MAYVMEAIVAEPAPQTGYDVMAGVRYGMNGSEDGAPSYDIYSNVDEAGGWYGWDDWEEDGIDSKWTNVQLTIDALTDTVTWSLADHAVEIATGAFNFIDQIKVIADSSAQALMSWSNLDIRFFNSSNEQVDSWASASGPTIDQMNEANPIEYQDILTITSEASNVTKVQLTARVRLACPEGVMLDQNSVFGQVLITTA